MIRRALLWAAVGMLVVVAAGCGRSRDSEPAVARPSLKLNRPRAPLGSPIEVTYEFAVAPGMRFADDDRVFVHFLDADGGLMFTDDHEPPVKTTSWKAGETVRYTRTVFLPIYPYVGPATIELGLYGGASGTRLKLDGTDGGQRNYRVATIELLPQTDNIFLVFKDGWNQPEVAPDNASLTWQWTKKEGTLSFRNPKRDVMLYLHVDGKPSVLPAPQKASVRIGEQVVDSFTLDRPGEIIRRVSISAAQLGQGDNVEVRVAVDPSFVPAVVTGGSARDTRELGLRVFHAFVELM